MSVPFDNEGGTIIGMTTNVVAAGTHTVRLVAACDPGGAAQSVNLTSARVGVVLLGG